MSLEYEKEKYKILKKKVDAYREELHSDREYALDMPIETENGFNIEREKLIEDIDEKLAILKTHEKEPYFAKLEFMDTQDHEEFKGYIGRLSIGEITDKSDEKIVDWRAPISDLYYNGRIGESEYRANGNTFTVDLKLKRQIDIKENEVRSIYDFEEAVSSDEFLKPYLTQSADNRLKNIVATIQSEQNDIIRLPVFQNCVVQGVAGSGKTTVALHRLSYLMYNFKKSIRPEEFLILSPNDIFMSYISSILVDLDANKANSFSLQKLFQDIIGRDYKYLSKHEQYTYLEKKKISTNYLAHKNSLEFKDALDKFLKDFHKETYFKPLRVKNIELLSAYDVYPFFNNTSDIDWQSLTQFGSQRLASTIQTNSQYIDKIKANLNANVEDITTKYKILDMLESKQLNFIKTNFNTNFNVIRIYTNFIKNLDKYTNYSEVQILKSETLKRLNKKELAYDDLASIIYLYSKLYNFPYYHKLKCIFIDEAQDLSVLMYIALRSLFPSATFSIFGDIAQGIYSYQSISNWQEVLNLLKDPKLLYLRRSYRTTIEIMEDANKELSLLKFEPAQNVVRHGDKVIYSSSNSADTIKKQLEDLNEYNNTAIICKDSTELALAQKDLAELNLVVLDENNLNYTDIKHSILTIQTAKGLEFDSVIIYNLNSFRSNVDNDLRLLYVAKTRALHKLIINSDK